LLIQSQPSYR